MPHLLYVSWSSYARQYSLIAGNQGRQLTLGRVTLGMTTTLSAEGASFLTLVSPPGWYWYGPTPPSCFQGSLPAALATARSEEALVGERACNCQHVKTGARGRIDVSGNIQKCHPARPKTPLMIANRTCRRISYAPCIVQLTCRILHRAQGRASLRS